MFILKAKPDFEKRFYYWCLKDWEREIRQGYPYLKKADFSFVGPLFQMLNSFSEGRRDQLTKGLVKRFRQREFFEGANIIFTDEEQRLAKLYLDVCQRSRWIKAGTRVITKYSEKRLNRKSLKKALFESLCPVFGDNYESMGSWGTWQYINKVGPWLVITSFDVEGRYHQLTYDHGIFASRKALLMQGISLLSWLGISGQTSWNDLSDSDIETTAGNVAVICSHFMNALPELLKGLEPDY